MCAGLIVVKGIRFATASGHAPRYCYDASLLRQLPKVKYSTVEIWSYLIATMMWPAAVRCDCIHSVGYVPLVLYALCLRTVLLYCKFCGMSMSMTVSKSFTIARVPRTLNTPYTRKP